MKFRSYITIFLSFLILAGAYEVFEAEGARKRSKTRYSQSSGSKSKRSKSSKNSRNSRKKKSTKITAPAPPPEIISNDSLTLLIDSVLKASVPENMNPGGLRVNLVKPDAKLRTANVKLNENYTYLPVTQELISSFRSAVDAALPDSLRGYGVNLSVGRRSLSYYITKVDKLPPERRVNPPFVRAKEPYSEAKKGMAGDVIALWHSHGRYYKNGSWQWQRPLLFTTLEDTYTMGYILPFVVPMLENAGAYVMLPRERDVNIHEVIVDNDLNEGGELYSQPYYREKSGIQKWTNGEGEGFIYDLKEFRDTENPFEVGTYRQVATIKGGSPSVAAWYADIPADGEYAVYISYKSLPNSTKDARYAVNYSGGTREFIVNQQMGGGTWIYLGTFPLRKGYSDTEAIVTLTNITDGQPGTVVTADAVKIGGGMGNIARSPRRSDVYYDPSTPEKIQEADDEEDDEIEAEEGDEQPDSIASKQEPVAELKKGVAPVFRTSGMPRFLEGARYWLHWAGIPESVYSPYHGSDDYKDDYTCRGHWVNYLAGGSAVLPNRQGLKIPVDISMALHTDAGKRSDDSFVGTLGIYYSNDGASYSDGTPRINSRMLTDMVMRQITSDIRQTYEPRWTRRSMWDKSYLEARLAEVPSTLIELLSHQNFADMMYGLDPSFRFSVGRSIYKAVARFLGERKDREVIIQPLPVKDFMISQLSLNEFRLAWEPTPDHLEPTADPTSYIIFERSGDAMGFHKIGETKNKYFDIKVTDDEIHSFRIVAANDGGTSFPGETLALRRDPKEKVSALIVNGFTRVSGPHCFRDPDGTAGFRTDEEFGVPYLKDISFAGAQYEFRRGAGNAFGNSSSGQVAQVIVGNTFDYAALHGESLASAGIGFVSASAGAVERGAVKLGDYKLVDLILGKQKATKVGNGKSGINFRAFPEALKHELKSYLSRGGRLIVSGQYIASDLYSGSQADRDFALSVLNLEEPAGERTRSGRLIGGGSFPYSSTLNESMYIVEHPDNLRPSEDVESEKLLEFSDNGEIAAFGVKKGKGRQVVMSVPFETLSGKDARANIMQRFLKYLDY